MGCGTKLADTNGGRSRLPKQTRLGVAKARALAARKNTKTSLQNAVPLNAPNLQRLIRAVNNRDVNGFQYLQLLKSQLNPQVIITSRKHLCSKLWLKNKPFPKAMPSTILRTNVKLLILPIQPYDSVTSDKLQVACHSFTRDLREQKSDQSARHPPLTH